MGLDYNEAFFSPDRLGDDGVVDRGVAPVAVQGPAGPPGHWAAQRNVHEGDAGRRIAVETRRKTQRALAEARDEVRQALDEARDEVRQAFAEARDDLHEAFDEVRVALVCDDDPLGLCLLFPRLPRR